MGDPRVLNRVSLATGQSLDGCDLAGANVGYRHRAGTQRLTVEKNGASTALSHATTEFRACQVKIVTQDPKQGRVRQHVDAVRFPVDLDLKYRHREFSFQCLCPSLQSSTRGQTAPAISRRHALFRVIVLSDVKIAVHQDPRRIWPTHQR